MNQNEAAEQQTSQGPIGEASSGESGVQSAAALQNALVLEKQIWRQASNDVRDATDHPTYTEAVARRNSAQAKIQKLTKALKQAGL